MTRIVALDLESYPDPDPMTLSMLEEDLRAPSNWKDEAKILAHLAEKKAALLEKAALSPLTGQVVAIGYAERDSRGGRWSEPEAICAVDGNEQALLEEFGAFIRQGDKTRGTRYVTFGGKYGSRGFDLRFIAIRMALHGIDIAPHQIPIQDRYQSFDLCGDLFGAFAGKLRHWAQRLLGETKLGEGADVADLVLTGKWEELAAYCRRDVQLVCQLFDRVSLTSTN